MVAGAQENGAVNAMPFRPRDAEPKPGKTFLKPDSGKCLHYYFYFMDADFGLIYLRVPTPAFAGAGSGHRSVCNSTATATAGWHGN